MFSLFRKNKNKKHTVAGYRVYLDYASITPIDPRVLQVINETYQMYPGNPSSLYFEGVEASKRLQSARQTVADVLEVHNDEIYFTSGGTEGDNLCIVGPIKAFLKSAEYKKQFADNSVEKKVKPHVISTVIEHPAILEILKHLSEMGVCDVSLLPIEADGRVDPRLIRTTLRPETVLVSVQYVNNEIGTIQPLQEIAKAIRHFKKEIGRSSFSFPYLHTDACQAPVYCSLRVPSLGVDLVTLDGSKIYGPRGCGTVYVRRGIQIDPILYGGDQENGVRAGTEALAQIAGFAEALRICKKDLEQGEEGARIASLRDRLEATIFEELSRAGIQVKHNGDKKYKTPNALNFCIEGMDAELAVLKLDARGIAVSSVTSCRSKKEDSSSYVVEALEIAQGELNENGAHAPVKVHAHTEMNTAVNAKSAKGVSDFTGCSKSSLRITLGRFVTVKEVDVAEKVVVEVLKGICV